MATESAKILRVTVRRRIVIFVSHRAGGIGLGVVIGWLLGSAPLPNKPIGGAAVFFTLGSAVAVSAALAGPDAGLAFLIGVLVSFVCRRALQHIKGVGEQS